MKIFKIILFFFCITFFSCASNHDEDLKLQIKNQISEDLISVSNSALDGLTSGFGSSLLSNFISKKDQGNFLLDPIMPHITSELNKKNTKELTLLSNGNMTTRLKLIHDCLINNREEISEDLKASSEILAPITTELIDNLMINLNTMKEDE